MDQLKRSLTLVLASAVGLAAAAGVAVLTWPEKGAAEAIKRAAAFEVCVVFFGATYLSGRFWARLLRARALAEEIRRNSSWHMRFLFLGAALLGAQRWWFARDRGWGRYDDWVTIGVALAFGASAVVFEIGRLRRLS